MCMEKIQASNHAYITDLRILIKMSDDYKKTLIHQVHIIQNHLRVISLFVVVDL